MLRKLLLLFAVMLSACTMTEPEPPMVLVGGATGRQGGAVVDEMLARGYRVRGLTRKPDGRGAQELAAKGVEVVQGDYGDPASLRAAMAGVDRMFFYSGFSRNEVTEGRNVIEAARAAGVGHVVYTSGAASEPGRGLAGAKMEVEALLVASGLSYAVLRPVAFMENFAGQQARTARDGLRDSRAPDRWVAFISIPDIGFLAAEALDSPAEWQGVTMNIAGDSMRVSEFVAIFSRVMGRDIEYHRVPLEEYLGSFPAPLRPLFRWYEEVGYQGDMAAALRQRYPNLTTLEQYLRATGWEDWQP